MNIKERFITFLWIVLVISLFCVNYVTNKYILKADSAYEVYIDGDIIGYINNDDDLYSLINKKQKEIKQKYDVDYVYPPENFKIVKTNSYDVAFSTAEEIYNKIEKLDTFTIAGYIVKIKSDDSEFNINVLDRDIFEKAINTFIMAFIPEQDYINFIEDTQPEIETTGKIYRLMYFDETITIKRGFISVKDKIFTKETDLSQYLLFGDDYKINNYEVKSGDTIASISEDNKLNPQEFLVANPKYTSEESLLTIGDNVIITLINPKLTFTCEISDVSDTEIPFEKKVVYDNSKPASYSEITTPGTTGISRISSEYIVKNGETQQGAVITKSDVLVAKVDQVTTKGSYQQSYITGTYVDDGSTWGWPTNQPYVITSGWAWRWGAFHDGIDISGTGYGSPIYASLDGTVVESANGGMLGWSIGYNVIIEHDNGYFTVYGHMVPYSMKVKIGDRVHKGQIIGSMGSSGQSTGTHLHFGLWYGKPYTGGRSINPLSLWR